MEEVGLARLQHMPVQITQSPDPISNLHVIDSEEGWREGRQADTLIVE